jgi:hypothetical protein
MPRDISCLTQQHSNEPLWIQKLSFRYTNHADFVISTGYPGGHAKSRMVIPFKEAIILKSKNRQHKTSGFFIKTQTELFIRFSLTF